MSTRTNDMSTIERSIEVEVPASEAYACWTRFERFPSFMDDIEDVTQYGDRNLTWKAKLLGKHERWTAEITEQIPDKRIAWRSTSGATHAGVVTFHRLTDDRSKVMLQIAFEPEGLLERVADALGLVARRVEHDLEQFKGHVETSARSADGWRGEIPAKPDAAQTANATHSASA